MNVKKHAGALNAAAFALSLAGGYVMCGTTVAGAASFVDISLCGALPLPLAAAVFTGAAVRSIVRRTVGRLIVKHAAMLLVVILKMFFEDRNDPRSCAAFTALGVFISGTAVSAVVGELMYKLPFYLIYAVISALTAYCISSLLTGIQTSRAVDLRGISGLYHALVYTVFAASLCTAAVPAVNAGVVLGAAATLTAAYFYGAGGGVTIGALTVCGAFLSSVSCGLTVVLLPAAGLSAGYLRRRRSVVAAGVFTAVCLASQSVMGVNFGNGAAMLDIIAGAGLFLAVSPFFSDRWIISPANADAGLRELFTVRSGFLADSLSTVREESERIARALAETSSRSTDIADNRRAVCDLCYRKASCWRTSREATLRGFRRLSELSEVSRETFPYELSDCLRRDDLIDAFSRSNREKASARLMSVKLAENRRSLFEQIKTTEELLATACTQTPLRSSAAVRGQVSSKLENSGYSPSDIIAGYDSRSRLVIEVYFPAGTSPDSFTRVRDLVSDCLKIQLDMTDPDTSGRAVRVRLTEPAEYVCDVYGAAACAEDNTENGDTFAAFSDGSAQYIILSDGMGSGRRAAFQSRMVVRLFRRLVSAGAGILPAVRLVNSIMFTKSGEETFATLDAVKLGLTDCTLTLVKSGASATLIRHRGSVLKVTAPTFPIGIYESGEAFVSDYDIEDGDIVIMFSDGISENEYLFIKELLLSGDDVRHIVDEICAKAELFDPNIRADDVTVIGIRVCRRENA